MRLKLLCAFASCVQDMKKTDKKQGKVWTCQSFALLLWFHSANAAVIMAIE